MNNKLFMLFSFSIPFIEHAYVNYTSWSNYTCAVIYHVYTGLAAVLSPQNI